MPLELAYDLATLALYDIVIFADDSGSMIFEEGGERINDLKVILGRVAEVATLFDEDGMPCACNDFTGIPGISIGSAMSQLVSVATHPIFEPIVIIGTVHSSKQN